MTSPAMRALTSQAIAEGSMVRGLETERYPIPEILNRVLVVIHLCSALAILHAASHAQSVSTLLVWCAAFAFVMQFGFCLVHEAVHGKLQRSRRLNLALGIYLFAFFPGSFHFFEVAHLVHHRRNRSDAELEDYVLPGESAWAKRLIYYLLVSGLFWILVPFSSIAIALVPRRRMTLPEPEENAGSFRRFVQFLNEVRPGRVRRDLIFTAAFWFAAIPLAGLTWRGIAACYAAFAFSWASQQYVYHVRTPRHAILGALDLRLWRPLELLYLHFNYHLTHHLAVWVPWLYLPRIAAEEGSRLGYFKTYLGLWRPPESIARAWPSQFQASGPLPLRVERETS